MADVEDQEVDYGHEVHLVAPSRLQSHHLRLEHRVQIHDQARGFQIPAYREITSEPKERWQHGIMGEELMAVGRERLDTRKTAQVCHLSECMSLCVDEALY